jgi:WhiB family redox-sensing transcriptional regulator
LIEFLQYLQDEPWMAEAACRGMSVGTFFPERGGSHREAKNTCAACPVRSECADYAQRTGTSYGIWGGHVLQRYKSKK